MRQLAIPVERPLPSSLRGWAAALIRHLGAPLVAAITLVPLSAAADPSALAPEVGWNQGDTETARTAAMGGSNIALGPDISGLFGNPANMAVRRVYHLAALAQIWPEARRQSYGAAAVDSVTGKLAGGIGGTYTIQDPDGLKRKATDVRLGLAFPLSDKIYVGAAGKYLKLRQDGLGPLGSSYASGGLKDEAIINGFTFDAGLTARPTETVSIGIMGMNLTNPGNSFRPLGLGGGLGIGTHDFSVQGDVVADFSTYTKTKLRYLFGGELLAADHFPIRGGYQYNDGLKSHAISGGLGYLDQQFGVELSVRRTVSPFQSTAVIIGLQYFLESSGITRSPVDID